MQNLKLDKYDLELIHYVKQENNPTLDGLKAIWAWRNCVDVRSIQTSFIVTHLLRVLKDEICAGGILGTMDQLAEDLHPDNRWKFSLHAEPGHWEDWLRVICSRLMLTEVVELPGYADYLAKAERKDPDAGNPRGRYVDVGTRERYQVIDYDAHHLHVVSETTGMPGQISYARFGTHFQFLGPLLP